MRIKKYHQQGNGILIFALIIFFLLLTFLKHSDLVTFFLDKASSALLDIPVSEVLNSTKVSKVPWITFSGTVNFLVSSRLLKVDIRLFNCNDLSNTVTLRLLPPSGSVKQFFLTNTLTAVVLHPPKHSTVTSKLLTIKDRLSRSSVLIDR